MARYPLNPLDPPIMDDITVKHANADPIAINTMANSGIQTMANSKPVVLANKGMYGVGSNTFTLAESTIIDCIKYKGMRAQITGLSNGDVITIQRSLDANNFFTETVITQTGILADTISANGVYYFIGTSYVKWAKTGANSSPIVTIAQS